MKKTVTMKALSLMLIVAFAITLSACSSTKQYDDSDVRYIEDGSSRYSIVHPMYEGKLILVKDNENGLFGAIDGKGEFALPCEYTSIEYRRDDFYILAKEDMYGLAKSDKGVIMPCEYQSIEPPYFDDWEEALQSDLIVALDKGAYGYYSAEDGSQVIKPQFQEAEAFMDTGLALVKKDGAWGITDRKGNMVLPAKYQISEEFEADRCFSGKLLSVVDEDGHRSVIDTDGNVVLSQDQLPDSAAVMLGATSSEGLTEITVEGDSGGQGVVDSKGSFIVPLGEDPILNEGNLFLVGELHTGTPRIIDSRGEEILEGRYLIDEDCDIPVEEFDTGLLIVRDRETGKTGRLDPDGNEVIPCRYDMLENIYWDSKNGKGLWLARDYEEKAGIVNEKGEEVVEPGFDDIGPFHEGAAHVMIDGKLGSIDSSGRELAPCKYEVYGYEPEAGTYLQNNEWGTDKIIPVVKKKGGKIALMNIRGELITDFQYTEASTIAGDNKETDSGSWGFTSSCMIVQKGGEGYGIVDEKGREILPCDNYDVVGETGNGLFLIRRTDSQMLSLIDDEGKSVSKPEFNLIETYMEGMED